jgi:hypothetical protein
MENLIISIVSHRTEYVCCGRANAEDDSLVVVMKTGTEII